MKKLNGYLHLYPAPQIDIGALTEYDSECKTYHFITGLLGLSVMPKNWVKVCASDADFLDESGRIKEGKSSDWYHSGYTVDGSPGILPFPEYLPADFFKSKKDNDTLSFHYGDMNVCLALKAPPHDSYAYQLVDDVHGTVTAAPSNKNFSEDFFGISKSVGLISKPPKKKKSKLPAYAPIIFAAFGAVGIAGIVIAGFVDSVFLRED
jgi:hypothetical protein